MAGGGAELAFRHGDRRGSLQRQIGFTVGTHDQTRLHRLIRNVVVAINASHFLKGYQEVITYSFVDPKVQQLIHAGEEALILPSPIFGFTVGTHDQTRLHRLIRNVVVAINASHFLDQILFEPVQAGLIMGTHREADLSLKRVKTLLNDKGYQEA
jgi:phenylalanyl-tRNA synthetase beta subunit